MGVIFCVYLIFGFLFVLNLFMEVVVNTFHKEKYSIENHDLMTDTQKEWVYIQLMQLNCTPLKKVIVTQSKVRNFCLQLSESHYFENFIMIAIFMNLLILTLYWVNIPDNIVSIMEIFNYIFVIIFTIEAAIKITGEGIYYFYSGWNIFDFLIVIGAASSIVIRLSTTVTVLATTTVIRTFRICRIFRLIRKAKSLYAIFQALVTALPALGNLGCLLLLFIYLFAVLGINLFAPL